MNINFPDNTIEHINFSDIEFPLVVSDVSDVASSASSTSSTNGCILLPSNYAPSNYDVLCGRGKGCAAFVGNRRFRVTIAMNKDRYIQAPTKLDKSLVVDEIVKLVASASPDGGFIKKDAATGLWCRISRQQARDKVAHAMRDAVQASDKKSQRQRKKSRRAASRKQKKSAVPETTQNNDAAPVEVPSSSEVISQVSNLRDSFGASFRGSLKDPNFAAYILEILGATPHNDEDDDISLISEPALFCPSQDTKV